MRGYFRFVKGIEAMVIVRTPTQVRLAGTCFRGPAHKVGGNFHRWHSVEELLADRNVFTAFCEDVSERIQQDDFQTHSLCVEYRFPVGWASTAPRKNYLRRDLEKFHPNRRSSAFRVRLSRTNLLVPETMNLTLVYELKKDDRGIAAVIYSIYPGDDIGELYEDITKREKIVFFDWNHPGVR